VPSLARFVSEFLEERVIFEQIGMPQDALQVDLKEAHKLGTDSDSSISATVGTAGGSQQEEQEAEGSSIPADQLATNVPIGGAKFTKGQNAQGSTHAHTQLDFWAMCCCTILAVVLVSAYVVFKRTGSSSSSCSVKPAESATAQKSGSRAGTDNAKLKNKRNKQKQASSSAVTEVGNVKNGKHGRSSDVSSTGSSHSVKDHSMRVGVQDADSDMLVDRLRREVDDQRTEMQAKEDSLRKCEVNSTEHGVGIVQSSFVCTIVVGAWPKLNWI
jgi:hypothetical protein